MRENRKLQLQINEDKISEINQKIKQIEEDITHAENGELRVSTGKYPEDRTSIDVYHRITSQDAIVSALQRLTDYRKDLLAERRILQESLSQLCK